MLHLEDPKHVRVWSCRKNVNSCKCPPVPCNIRIVRFSSSIYQTINRLLRFWEETTWKLIKIWAGTWDKYIYTVVYFCFHSTGHVWRPKSMNIYLSNIYCRIMVFPRSPRFCAGISFSAIKFQLGLGAHAVFIVLEDTQKSRWFT